MKVIRGIDFLSPGGGASLAQHLPTNFSKAECAIPGYTRGLLCVEHTANALAVGCLAQHGALCYCILEVKRTQGIELGYSTWLCLDTELKNLSPNGYTCYLLLLLVTICVETPLSETP